MSDASGYVAAETRRYLLQRSGYRDDYLVRVAFRPFDDRWLYWERQSKLLDRNRVEFFDQLTPGNLYLSASTKGRRGVNLPTVTDKFGARHLQDPYSQYFPLYIRSVATAQQSLFVEPERQANVAPAILDQVMQIVGPCAGDRMAVAKLLFYHILAVSRAPLYESENAGYLMQDWPRIPLPATRDLLEASAALGQRVGDLLRPDVPFTPSVEERKLAIPRRANGAQLADDDPRHDSVQRRRSLRASYPRWSRRPSLPPLVERRRLLGERPAGGLGLHHRRLPRR